jgi:hypothetical protein
LRDIVISDRGLKAAYDAGAVSYLFDILNGVVTESKEVISTSVLILSRMVDCSHKEMVNKDAIASLCRVGDYPLSDEASITLAQILSKCFRTYVSSLRSTWAPDGTFPNPAPLFIRLLSAACTGVRLAAASAIKETVESANPAYTNFIRDSVNPILPLCLLCADCRSLAELELTISAICAVVICAGPP